MKKYLSLFLTLFVVTVSCQPVENKQAKKVTPVSSTKVDEPNKKTLELPKAETFENFPEKPGNVPQKEKDDFDKYLKSNDIFKLIPYTPAEKYFARFTGDGTPIFLTGDGTPVFNKGLTGDGTPVFSTKAENEGDKYIWSRKENKLVLDYFQLINSVENSWGITSYGRYSQVIENKIKVEGAVNNEKNVNLVKSMGFGLLKEGEKYKLQSITPIAIRKTERDTMAYHILKVSFTTDKNQLLIHGFRKLIPIPGISINNQIGSHKVRVEIQVRLLKPEQKFTAMLSIKDRIYELYKINNYYYGANIELPTLSSPDLMVIELIDKDSLVKNEDYNGFTFMIPVTE